MTLLLRRLYLTLGFAPVRLAELEVNCVEGVPVRVYFTFAIKWWASDEDVSLYRAEVIHGLTKKYGFRFERQRS